MMEDVIDVLRADGLNVNNNDGEITYLPANEKEKKDMVKAGDRIILKKEMGAFKNIGEECIVLSVNDNIISFRFGNGLHLGCMSEDELNKYFDVVIKDAPTVTEEMIKEIIDHSEITTNTIYDKCTIVTMKLENGFIITESSACVSVENYDEKIGYDICMKKIIDKLWELEGYYMQKSNYDNQRNSFDW